MKKVEKVKLPWILCAVLVVFILAGLYYFINREGNNTESKVCTTYGHQVEKQCIEDYIGLTLEEANLRAKNHKYTPESISLDFISKSNKEQGFTDVGGWRINFITKDGVVIGGFFPGSEPTRTKD